MAICMLCLINPVLVCKKSCWFLHIRHFLIFLSSRKSFWLNKDNKLVCLLVFTTSRNEKGNKRLRNMECGCFYFQEIA